MGEDAEELGEDAVEGFQSAVRAIVPERFRLPRVFTALALVEELAELIADFEAPAGASANSVLDEVGDLLFSCAEIANEYDFTLTVADTSSSAAPTISEFMILAGRIAKNVLEIECFDRHASSELLVTSTRKLTAALLSTLQDRGSRPRDIFRRSLEKMRNRIESGKWESVYGELLLKKRLKHD